jgi:hypothetical protein
MTQINSGAGADQKTGPDADSLNPMSQHHAHARTPEADRIALDWLAGYDPKDGHGLIGNTSPHHQFGRDIVLAAFAAGRSAQAAESIVPLRGAVALLTEGAQVFRGYENHHREKAQYEDGSHTQYLMNEAAIAKAEANAAIAQRFEDFLQLDTTPRDRLAGLALSLCQDLDALMGESGGVYGLHQNGDVAPWDSLRRGGVYEDWLQSFDKLIEALDGMFPVAESHCSCATGAQGAPVDASCPVHGLPDDDEEEADPAATVRTIEAAVAGGLIPGFSTARLGTARRLSHLNATMLDRGIDMGVLVVTPQAVPGVYSPERGQPAAGMDPDVVAALRQAHDGAE